jgi:hypothetical protein
MHARGGRICNHWTLTEIRRSAMSACAPFCPPGAQVALVYRLQRGHGLVALIRGDLTYRARLPIAKTHIAVLDPEDRLLDAESRRSRQCIHRCHLPWDNLGADDVGPNIVAGSKDIHVYERVSIGTTTLLSTEPPSIRCHSERSEESLPALIQGRRGVLRGKLTPREILRSVRRACPERSRGEAGFAQNDLLLSRISCGDK